MFLRVISNFSSARLETSGARALVLSPSVNSEHDARRERIARFFALSTLVFVASTAMACIEPETCTETATCPLRDAAWDTPGDADFDQSHDATTRADAFSEADSRAQPDGNRDADALEDVATDHADTSGSDTDSAGPDSSNGSDAITFDTSDALNPTDVFADHPCDFATRPSEDACIIDEKYGVFVSPTGNDMNGAGTRKAPFKTLAKGLTVALNAKSVYACDNGTPYAEQVTLTSGSKLFGGFSCDDWSYATTRKAIVKAPASPALSVQSAAGGALAEDMQFEAPDAATAGASSFAAIVVSTRNVWMRRVSLIAGKGADGTAGADGAKGTDGAINGAGQQGLDATCSNTVSHRGGIWTISECDAAGGHGGPSEAGMAGMSGSRGFEGADNSGAAEMDGGNGAAGSAGIHGLSPAATGTFGATSYSPALAGSAAASNGTAAQGGGGGGSSSTSMSSCVGASGGAGGSGGCFGFAGTSGTSGGASVALHSWLSTVKLDNCTLTTRSGGNGGNGGNGGPGGAGQVGGLGGAGSPADNIAKGGNGGKGGDGGPGGSGAGGTGGPSYAMVTNGTSPQIINGTTLTNANGGAAGIGGTSGGPNGTKAPDGFPGGSAQELIIPTLDASSSDSAVP